MTSKSTSQLPSLHQQIPSPSDSLDGPSPFHRSPFHRAKRHFKHFMAGKFRVTFINLAQVKTCDNVNFTYIDVGTVHCHSDTLAAPSRLKVLSQSEENLLEQPITEVLRQSSTPAVLSSSLPKDDGHHFVCSSSVNKSHITESSSLYALGSSQSPLVKVKSATISTTGLQAVEHKSTVVKKVSEASSVSALNIARYSKKSLKQLFYSERE